MAYLECIECGKTYPDTEILYTCISCQSLLEVKYKKEEIGEDPIQEMEGVPLGVWRYRPFLPCDKQVSLNEGNTPLYHAPRLADWAGVDELYIKNEGGNPTGSFKDRGMTVGVSKAIEMDIDIVGCASTGNTSASLAAYGARAGVEVVVLLPSGKVAMGKVAQALIHGAKVISIDGNFDRAMELVQKAAETKDIYVLNSVNPVRLEGQKTIGFEIIDQLNREEPDVLVLPVGNAGNMSAIHKSFKEWIKYGIINKIPKMIGIQSEGSMPFVRAVKNSKSFVDPEPNPETMATAIRIGDPVNGPKALRAIKDTDGTAESVSDSQIVQAQKKLARLEGIGVEPASASSVAGLKKLVDKGIVESNEKVVCLTTGHMLKDSQEVVDVCEPPIEVDADIKSILEAIG